MSDDYIQDWDHFIAISKRLEKTEKIYRGQADSSWSLRPCLTRVFKNSGIEREEAIEIEKKLLTTFQENNSDDSIARFNPANKILWWTVMQHFGAPTRLLDWSNDIKVALYFAVCDQFDKDGALFCFDDGHLNFIRHIRQNAEWADIDRQLEKSIAGKEYETAIYAFTNEIPIDRKTNQQSCWTITTELTEDIEGVHDKIADRLVFEGVYGGEGHSLVIKYIIDRSLKVVLLKELMALGITGQYLFPGLDGLGKQTTDLLNTMVAESAGNVHPKKGVWFPGIYKQRKESD